MKPFKQRQEELRTRQEMLLRRYEFAAQFKNRPRRPLWFYLLLYSAGFLAPVLFGVFFLRGVAGFWLWPVMLSGILLAAYYTWQNAAPICPSCAKNIVWDSAAFCHLCGEALNHDRCERCGVNTSWTSVFDSLHDTGNHRRILYCPSCGAWLNTSCYRWRSGANPG